MATRRFSHLDDFVLKGGKIGIGTVDPSATLEVVGTVKAANIKATDSGITTSISLEGVLHQNMQYPDSVSINSGDSGTLSGEVVIGTGTTLSVGTGATTGQGIIESFKVSNTFTPPIGGTVDRPTAPQPGALFYNKDFKTIEYWDGHFWRHVDYTTTRGRSVFMGGYIAPANIFDIDFIEIATLGHSISFGDLFSVKRGAHDKGPSNNIRGMQGGGYVGPTISNVIDYITFATEGNALDFGDTWQTGYSWSAASNNTRGVWTGGYSPSNSAVVNVMHYVNIMSLGNSQDFGDIQGLRRSHGSNMSPTRGVIAGGYDNPSPQSNKTREDIEYYTIASGGHSNDFGDLTESRDHCPGASNTTRGIFSGGRNPTNTNTMDYVTMASTGNATDFGDSTFVGVRPSGSSSHTRGIFTSTSIIEYVEIATTGNALDFGDLRRAKSQFTGCSDSHGGLGGY